MGGVLVELVLSPCPELEYSPARVPSTVVGVLAFLPGPSVMVVLVLSAVQFPVAGLVLWAAVFAVEQSAEAPLVLEIVLLELEPPMYPVSGYSYVSTAFGFPALFAFSSGPAMVGAVALCLEQFPVADPVVCAAALFLEQFPEADPIVCAVAFVVKQSAKAHPVAEEVLVMLIPSWPGLGCSQAEISSTIVEVLASSSGPLVGALSAVQFLVVGPVVWVAVFAVEQSAESPLVVEAVLPWPSLSSHPASEYSSLLAVIPSAIVGFPVQLTFSSYPTVVETLVLSVV